MSVQLKRAARYLNSFVKRNFLVLKVNKKEPTFVFHHLPRCGGTSLRRSIMENKNVFSDYRIGWGSIYPLKYPLAKLGKNDCLCGHFELDGYHLFERYPEIFCDSRFRLFTFIRNPLDLAISNYFYRLKKNQEVESNIRDSLLRNNNYLAKILNVDIENYKEIMDRYNYIGIVEHYQESLHGLSLFMDCDGLIFNKINGAEKNEQLDAIKQEDIDKFKLQNSLDYLIYEYAIYKFNMM